ncbi:MAG: sugar phosphate isomerase/epimerase family protein [Acidimicrobiales bacterium]
MVLGSEDLVLCSGTLSRETTFEQRIAAAVAGGFAGISMWGRDYLQARAAGLSDADLVAMLGQRGLCVAELDPVWSWLPGASDIRVPPELDRQDVFCFGEHDLFAIADAVGARSVNAVDVFGGSWTLESAAEAFAGLCRRAHEHGLLVQLEFLPWSRIPDLHAAWEVVRDAGQDNGGITIDAWHYFRSGPDPALLERIPACHIVGVQLSDGPSSPETDLLDATLHERLLPGEGEMDLASLVAALRRTGTGAPFGVEVFSDQLHQLPAAAAAARAGDAARSVLGWR